MTITPKKKKKQYTKDKAMNTGYLYNNNGILLFILIFCLCVCWIIALTYGRFIHVWPRGGLSIVHLELKDTLRLFV